MKIIYGGHYQEAPEGWVAYSYEEQDITHRLKQDDNSIECVLIEHIFEHLPFDGAINFVKESLRVLKPGGVLRIVCPTIDKLIEFKTDDLGRHFSDFQLKHYFPNEDAALKELGLDGIREEPLSFLFHSLIKGHNHIHVWTSQLIKKVVEKIGFSEVYICEPGETHFNQEYCLERKIRGVEPNYFYEHFNLTTFDPESRVVEAKK